MSSLLDTFKFPSTGGGTDPYFANVVLLLHGEGSNGSTTITDSSSLSNSLTAVGDAKISTAQAKYGSASIVFDGTGDYIDTPNPSSNANFDFAAGDFTIETWVRPTATTPMLVYGSLHNNSGLGQLWLIVNATFSGGGLVQFGYNTTALGTGINVLRGTGTLSTSTWHHIAVCRNGSNVLLFVDGVQQGTSYNISTAAIYAYNATSRIGYTKDGATYAMVGNVDEFRITKGVARYTADFTPAGPFPDS